MGSELVGSSSSHKKDKGDDSDVALFSHFTKVFEDLFPLYLSIGMTYEEYWEKDCLLTKYYLKAFRLKEERNLQNKNHELWLQGAYIYTVLCKISPILNAFAKKGTKPEKYLDKPLPLSQEELEERQDAERIERMNLVKKQFMDSAKKK